MFVALSFWEWSKYVFPVLLSGRDSLVVSFLIFDYIIHCSGVIIGCRNDNVLGLLATANMIVEETLE